MVKPKYKNYSVCYPMGKREEGKEIYQLNKYCKCSKCTERFKVRKPVSSISITTLDISKVDDIAEYLETWECEKYGLDYYDWDSQSRKKFITGMIAWRIQG